MILGGSNNYNITQGDFLRTPQENDASVVVPPTVLPVVLSLRPTIVNQPNSIDQDGSTLEWNFIARNNQAAASTPIIRIKAGLWELEVTCATWFNYTPTPPLTSASDAGLSFQYEGITTPILARYPQTGSFTDFNRLRILIKSVAEISLVYPATGAAEHLIIKGVVNAIRIL